MGAGTSKQRLGERVVGARRHLESASKMQQQRTERIQSVCPETLDVIVRNVADSFERCSPFSEALLLVAFQANPEEVLRVVTKSCKKVLSAPIRKEEFEWFKQYVFPSTLWMLRTKYNSFMFEEMMKIAKGMSAKIDLSMDSIYAHLQTHQDWSRLTAIENETIIVRQDDDRVGLLKENGIKDAIDAKNPDADDDGELVTFIDTNLAVNMLTTTAKKVNTEVQSQISLVMSRFGEFKAGPMKTVGRCQSKVENEYMDATYPKAAKLLDLVRCSVSFNTLEQFLTGYDGLMRYVKASDSLELARIKNGFLETEASYRDIKINVVYQGQTHN